MVAREQLFEKALIRKNRWIESRPHLFKQRGSDTPGEPLAWRQWQLIAATEIGLNRQDLCRSDKADITDKVEAIGFAAACRVAQLIGEDLVEAWSEALPLFDDDRAGDIVAEPLRMAARKDRQQPDRIEWGDDHVCKPDQVARHR